MREEDEQEKQFVPMGVDETGPSSSLQRNGIHDVECGCKDSLVDVEVRKHHPLVPLEEILKDVNEERRSGYDILNGMVSLFISNGVSLFIRAMNCPQQNISGRRSVHCKIILFAGLNTIKPSYNRT